MDEYFKVMTSEENTPEGNPSSPNESNQMDKRDVDLKSRELKVDIVIFGGGIAGLWLFNRLRQAGYQTILLETKALGSGQTRYAQGIIHGGTKYALTGKLTASTAAVFAMPKIWRDCLAGKGEVDLSAAVMLSAHQYMWSTPSLFSRLSGFFASRVMRGKTIAVKKADRPVVFQHKNFKGKVYQLDEPVLDTSSVINALAKPNINNIMHIKPEIDFTGNTTFTVETSEGERWNINTQKIILTAGEGNAVLLKSMGRKVPAMQLRPLQMVMLRGGLPEKLYAHCLGASVNPRITITSHTDKNGDIIWYMGGQLAEEGINRTEEEQINEAKKELRALMPWLDFSVMQWATLNINRAEPKQKEGKRPASSFFYEEDDVITTWPTKMALSPKLAEDVLNQLQDSNVIKSGIKDLPEFSHTPFAELPWLEETRWK